MHKRLPDDTLRNLRGLYERHFAIWAHFAFAEHSSLLSNFTFNFEEIRRQVASLAQAVASLAQGSFIVMLIVLVMLVLGTIEGVVLAAAAVVAGGVVAGDAVVAGGAEVVTGGEEVLDVVSA